MMWIQIGDEDHLLFELLTGRVVEVSRDEEDVLLVYADGHKVILSVEAFALVETNFPEC